MKPNIEPQEIIDALRSGNIGYLVSWQHRLGGTPISVAAEMLEIATKHKTICDKTIEEMASDQA